MKKFKRVANTVSENRESGQSLTEMAILIPFLLILLIGIIELSQAFVAYIGLVNAAREGAVYASLHPDLSTAADINDISCTECAYYVERIKGEIIAVGLDTDNLQTLTNPVAPTIGINCSITTTVSYQLTTFTSGINLPLVGRFGLPSSYMLRYAFGMPIRNAEIVCP